MTKTIKQKMEDIKTEISRLEAKIDSIICLINFHKKQYDILNRKLKKNIETEGGYIEKNKIDR